MKYTFPALVAVAVSVPGVVAQGCPSGAQLINGNWYCKPVQAISYLNWGTPGSYNKVTAMEDGQCQSTAHSYGGGMAPMHEGASSVEVSMHFRGPLTLKQFAFYSPGSSAKTKREARPSNHDRRHNHEQFHHHDKEVHAIQEEHLADEKRAVGDWVTAVINGATVSWQNNYGGAAAATPAPAAATGNANPAPTVAPSATAPSPAASMNAGAGNWGRQAYFNADKQTADGLVFLNNMGGQGSGVFDTTFGLSMSYASSDAMSGASSPQILQNKMVDDAAEFAIFSNQECNGDCGYARPGSVAYHGFDGPHKVFLMEFSMPATGKTGSNMDMPAVWMLNAQIPRTMQYATPHECSCWDTGCGEWDIFEILDSGNTRAISSFHGNTPGGDPNYFVRPTSGTMKAAVVFDGNASAGHIVILPDDTNFDTTFPDSVIAGWVNTVSSSAEAAVFSLPS